LNSSVDTEQTITKLRHRNWSNPGWLKCQTITHTEASTSSTAIPAAPTAARCHLFAIIQASVVSQ
jgi:hypothetical protein